MKDEYYLAHAVLYYDLDTIKKADELNITGSSILIHGEFYTISSARNIATKAINNYNERGIFFDKITITIEKTK